MSTAFAHGPHLWVLNPGAERELMPGSTANQRTREQMRARAHLFDDLCAGEARVWLEDLRSEATRAHDGQRALLWCPTADAQRVCRARNLEPQAAPPSRVLQRVLSKEFLGGALPEWTAPHHRGLHSLDEYLALRSSVPGALRAKRMDGYAGKGQRTLSAEERPGDRLWVEQNVLQAGLVVEAELSVLGEFSVHGMVTSAGCVVGEPCQVHIDHARAPAAIPTPSPNTPHAGKIRSAGHAAALALADAGYFGPFGLDLILTAERLYATDLNARFTLGFSAGFGAARQDALEQLLALPRV